MGWRALGIIGLGIALGLTGAGVLGTGYSAEWLAELALGVPTAPGDLSFSSFRSPLGVLVFALPVLLFGLVGLATATRAGSTRGAAGRTAMVFAKIVALPWLAWHLAWAAGVGHWVHKSGFDPTAPFLVLGPLSSVAVLALPLARGARAWRPVVAGTLVCLGVSGAIPFASYSPDFALMFSAATPVLVALVYAPPPRS
jgi:hypothetical protein